MTKKYNSSLTNAQWQIIEKKLPEQMVVRKRTYPLKEIFDSLLYVLMEGCKWRSLPNDLVPWETVYYYFREWRANGLLEYLSQELGGDYREKIGRKRSPSVGIIDAQSVKGTAISCQSETGYDAGKKVKGRKRHLMVDTQGLIITVFITSADWQDRTAAYWLFVKASSRQINFKRLTTFFADGGYSGKLIHFVKNEFKNFGWNLNIIKHKQKINTFKVLPMRWIVERNFAWLDNCRRFLKNMNG